MRDRIVILSILALIPLFVYGCISREYNVATGKEDVYFISTDKEIEMGRRIAESIEKNPGIKLDPEDWPECSRCVRQKRSQVYVQGNR
jgi:hypothetical protein